MDVQLEQPAAPAAARRSLPRRGAIVAAIAAVAWLVLAVVVPGPAVAGWALAEAGKLLLLAALAALLWVLPGLALLRLLVPNAALGLASRLAMALGCGIALPPLLLELASLAGLRWGRAATIAYLAVALIAVLWSYGVEASGKRRGARGEGHEARGERPIVSHSLSRASRLVPGLLLGGLLVAGFVLRVFLMRDLPVGMWGDSYHHTMIAQLLVDNGGLFRSWEPYAPLSTFTYHFGFHANVAFFHWLTGVPVTRSLLYVGQLINWATLPAAYLLTRQLTGSRWAAVIAVVLTGFANQQPLYYINWGRYTQLDGQAVLPALFVAWILLLEPRGERQEARGPRPEAIGEPPPVLSSPPLASRLSSLASCLLPALLTASMMLTHYVVTMFAALLVGVYVVGLLAFGSRRPLHIVARSLLTVALAVMLAAPWLWNTLGGYLVRNVAGAGGDGGAAAAPGWYNAVGPDMLAPPLLVLAVAGSVLAIVRRDWRTSVLVVWVLLLILLTKPQAIGLPGAGVVTWFAVYIALYLPAIPLAAYALAMPLELLARRRGNAARLVATAAVIGVSVWGLRWQQKIVDPYFQLFRPADGTAMAWIREHTAPDDRFLVNMFYAESFKLMAGSDAGWWIALLTGRQTTLPPITYGSERSTIPDFAEQVKRLGFDLREHPPSSEWGIHLLREAGIDYVYVGAHQAPERANQLDPIALRASPAFELVYERGGVEIFRLRSE